MLLKLSKEEEKRAYSIISEELIAGKVDNAIWTKAFSESDGNSDKAKAKYIKYRFKEVEEKIVIQKDLERRQEAERNSRENIEAENKKLKSLRASERIRQIKNALPWVEDKISQKKSILMASTEAHEKLCRLECILVEEIKSSSGLKEKIKSAKLRALRNKIEATKIKTNNLAHEVNTQEKIIENYLKELRDLEHYFGS